MTKSTKSKPTHLYASISIAIVLFLLGVFFTIMIHTQNLGNLLKEKVNIVVEVSDDHDEKEVMHTLTSHPIVKKGSVRYISKEEGLQFMTRGEEVDFLGENPLKNLVLFNVNAQGYTDDNIEGLKQELSQLESTLGVYSENIILENIKSNLTKVALLFFVLGLVFVFLAVIIIRNTINLSMFADREEILTLGRIGAKKSFIKMPYIKSSVMIGMRGLVLAILCLVTVLVAISINFKEIWSSLNLFYILLSFLLLLVVAVMVPALVSNAAANSYLKRR